MNRKQTFAIALVLSAFVVTCSDNQEPTGPDPEIPTFLITPSSGKPGDMVRATGLPAIDSSNLDQHSFFIGDEPLPVRLINDTVYLAVPLFYDSAVGWSNPPSGPSPVEHHVNGVLTSQSSNDLTVLGLPEAPGTIREIQSLVDSLAGNLDAIFDALPIQYPWEAELRDSMVALVRHVAYGGDNSIEALLDGTSPLLEGATAPPDPALADALLASVGAVEYWQEYVGYWQPPSSQSSQSADPVDATAASATEVICEPGGPDVELACLMQMYELLDDFADEFLAETSREWNQSAGIIFEYLQVVPGVTRVCGTVCMLGAMIGPTLQMLDVIVNNAVLSLYPSEITTFGLDISPDSIDIDQHTTSQVTLMAKNTPETLTLNEVISGIMAAASLVGGNPTEEELRPVLWEIARIWTEQFRSTLTYMAEVDPNVFDDVTLHDPEVFTFPTLYWGPVQVTDQDLVTYHTLNPDVIVPDTSVMLEWEGVSRGTGQVNAHTRTAGDRSKKIRDWLVCYGLCSYSGGAFGEDAATSNTVSVIVGRLGELDVVIEGLPADLEADVLVVFPDSTEFRHLTATTALTGLEPGEYRIQAYDRTDASGEVYEADPAEQTAVVESGETTTATVDYGSNIGNVLFTVSGLPYYVDADIAVSGPDGASYHLVGDTLLDSLAVGDYTFTGHRVSHASSNRAWDAHPETQTLTVIGGETATGGVDYKSIYGTVVVDVRKPASRDADIDLEGDSLTRHITRTTTIDQMPVGSYTLTAHDVPLDSSVTLFADPPSQTVDVTAGDTTFATVEYEAPLVVTWTYGPARGDLGNVSSRTIGTWSSTPEDGVDTATVEETLSPPGFQVNDRYQVITTPSVGVSSSATTSTAYADAEGSVSISGGGTSGTINLRAVATSQRVDGVRNTAYVDIGFGQAGSFKPDTILNPDAAMASGLNIKVFNPSEKPFYFLIDWNFDVSSDLEADPRAHGEYHILYDAHQYWDPDALGPFSISWAGHQPIGQCDDDMAADTACWRGEKVHSFIQYGTSPAFMELFIRATATVQTIVSPDAKDENASLDGIININVMEGEPPVP